MIDPNILILIPLAVAGAALGLAIAGLGRIKKLERGARSVARTLDEWDAQIRRAILEGD